MDCRSLIIALSACIILTSYMSADYKVLCLRGGVYGQDQKLKGLYHSAYSTADDYRCYIKFNPKDIELLPPAKVSYDSQYKNYRTAPTMPSYDGKLVYFINNVDEYMPLINLLKQKGLPLKDIGQALKVIVKNSWEEIAQELK